MDNQVIDTFCKNCGTRYSFTKTIGMVLIKGDWFGHHPDHYEHYESDNLKDTPCPKCGTFNEELITLRDLEKIRIKSMTKEEQHKHIFSEMIINNNKRITEIDKEINDIKEIIALKEGTIKEFLKKVNNNKTIIDENNIIMKELQNITVEEYKQKQINSLESQNKQLQGENVSLFRNRKNILNEIKEKKDRIEELQLSMDTLKNNSGYYNYIIENITKEL